jgi:Cd2+/Zn2+-exporting ATPase
MLTAVQIMSTSLEKSSGHDHETGRCLARSVVDTLAGEPALEAVTIDRAQHKISIATLGRVEIEPITERLTHKLEAAQSAVGETCGLLTGQGNCWKCGTPLPETERQRITIQNDGPTTTIARITCPTAPKFWRWRDIPFPRMVPRDVEYLESAEHIE